MVIRLHSRMISPSKNPFPHKIWYWPVSTHIKIWHIDIHNRIHCVSDKKTWRYSRPNGNVQLYLMPSPVKCSNTPTFTMYTYNKRHTFSLTVLVRLFSYRFSWRKEIYTVTALPFITFLLLMWWKNIMAEEQKKDVRFYTEHSQYNRNISSFWLLSFHEAVIVVQCALMLRAPLFFLFME